MKPKETPNTPRWSTLSKSPESSRALEDLLAGHRAATDGAQLLTELRKSERRSNTILAFVPFIGPWIAFRSDAHSAAEKKGLAIVSLVLTFVAAALIWAQMPSETDENRLLHARVLSDLRVLDRLAHQYQIDHGKFPDAAVWRRYSERADSRFFDPWARPYRFDRTPSGIRVFTLGRDGEEGGRGQDEDVSFESPPHS